MRLGYLVPEFPGQTHAFFWREIKALERLGADVRPISTRLPRRSLISHDWAADAIARTAYLLPADLRSLSSAARHASLVPRLMHAGRAALGAGEASAVGAQLLQALPLAARLHRLARAEGLAHLHVHSCARSALVALLARRMGGPAYSLTLHGPLADYGPGQGLKWSGATFGTVITEALHGELTAQLGPLLPDRVLIQPMGVDTDAFRRSGTYRPYDGTGPLKLFSCARLNPVKGHRELISAVARLRTEGLAVRLVIAGEDDQGGEGFRSVVAAHITALGLGGEVVLLGAVGEAEVRRQLLEAHMFVLASWHEPLGVAYMEAMSCGLPVIGTAAGGVAELIREGVDGVLVPPRNVEELVAAIRALARDPARCRALGTAGRSRIEAGFSAQRGAETLLRAIATGANRG